MVGQLSIFGLIDSKLTFESRVRSLLLPVLIVFGILRKARLVLRDDSIDFGHLFCLFWSTGANNHLAVLDRNVRVAFGLRGGIIDYDLWHRRRVAALSVFFKIRENVEHPVWQWIGSKTYMTDSC